MQKFRSRGISDRILRDESAGACPCGKQGENRPELLAGMRKNRLVGPIQQIDVRGKRRLYQGNDPVQVFLQCVLYGIVIHRQSISINSSTVAGNAISLLEASSSIPVET